MNVSPDYRSAGVVNIATGTDTSDNTAAVVTLGFRPRYVKVINQTDVIIWEKIDGMAAANAIKVVTAGTTTLDTGSAIVIDDNGFTISAGAAGNAKALAWVAYA